MAIIKATRRTKYKRNFHSSSIKSLQNKLLTEVLGHVASTSFTDLFNVKLSCKYFLEVAKDDYIFQRISLEKFPIVPLCISNEASSFLKRCEEFGNPESLFRQRVIDYFSLMMIESELVYLKRAAEKGHSEATYVYEIILLCSEDQLKQEGLKILSSLKMTKSSGLKECRKRMRTVMRDMWISSKKTMPSSKKEERMGIK
ncbi:hypothetical protein ACB092_05G175200 [Castanea dentata]